MKKQGEDYYTKIDIKNGFIEDDDYEIVDMHILWKIGTEFVWTSQIYSWE